MGKDVEFWQELRSLAVNTNRFGWHTMLEYLPIYDPTFEQAIDTSCLKERYTLGNYSKQLLT